MPAEFVETEVVTPDGQGRNLPALEWDFQKIVKSPATTFAAGLLVGLLIAGYLARQTRRNDD